MEIMNNIKISKMGYAWLLTGAAWVVAFGLYGSMPERMATHWNALGEANGYSGRFMGLFLVPIIMLVIQILFVVFPKIDPLKNNSEQLKKQSQGVALLLAVFMAYLFGAIITWNNGMVFSMTSALVPAFAVLVYGLGVVLKEVRRNWFIGIRTPWTMSSDGVWDKTHALGGEMFKIAGTITLVGLFVPVYAIGFIVMPILISTLAVVIYSYVVFKKEEAKDRV